MARTLNSGFTSLISQCCRPAFLIVTTHSSQLHGYKLSASFSFFGWYVRVFKKYLP